MSALKFIPISLLIFTAVALAAPTSQPAAPKDAAIAVDAPGAATRETPNAGDDYRLVWSDEFDTDGPLNPKDWVFEEGFIRNLELQWYQPQNAMCADGFLTIEAKREWKENPNYVAGSTTWPTDQKRAEYTSACVKTIGKHSWLYGRFVMRARIDTRAGSWPAFWMMGDHGDWPARGEVDVMEYYRNTLLANVAWARVGGPGSAWNAAKKPLAKFPADWADHFHTWRMDWDANFIKLYCDDQLMNTQDLSKTINPDGTNPFHGPMHILLNQAIGGVCGGDPSKTKFPMRYVIDYVRVYQRPSQIATTQRTNSK